MEGVRNKRRGTKPPTSPRDRTSPQQIKTKKQKTPRERAEAHKTDTRETCAVDQLRTPSARKPHNGNSDQQPREANTPATLPKKLDNTKQKDKVRDDANAKAFPS